ncbi:MAG: RNA polymerase sigma-54 factor, partial [Gimesia chilikensis]
MKLGQQMKLAPRMIQSMEILQLPLQALEERIDQELAENVCLERVSDTEGTTDTETELMRSQADDDANSYKLDEKEMVAGNETNNESDFERLLEMAEQWPEDN